MKIQIVSDLHVDVNKDGNFGFRIKPDYDILLIAGDIAGGYEREEKFLTGLAKDVTCPIYAIAGNHLGYDYSDMKHFMLRSVDLSLCTKLIGTKQWSIDYLKKHTPRNVCYMDNDWVDLGDYILFGGTMYSDYNLYENTKLCKQMGEMYLNDFRYVYEYFKKEKVIRPVTADDYVSLYKKFLRRLNKCYKETNKDLIVMTHFAPSIKSIHSQYLEGNNKYINASYASNMEKYIRDHERIKYWVHGHVHSEFDYMIEQCRVLCYPYGYHKNKEQIQSQIKWFGKTLEL